MRPHRSTFGRVSVVAVMWVILPVTAVRAQTPPGRWELEGYGGVALARLPTSGSRAVPSPGPPILTSSPTVPSRQISSWFFGDGATLMNGVVGEFGVPNTITALDSAFSALRSTTGGAVGFRLRRALTARFSAEFSVDAMLGSTGHADGLAAVVESTRASFKDTFTALLATGPFSGVVVDATAGTSAGARRDVVASGALVLRLALRGGFAPYATVGAGVMTGGGQFPSATLQGHYRFSILGQVPIDETDRVTLRYARSATLVGVFGGGVARELSDRWGIRVDARAFVGRNNTTLLLDANPSVARGAPAGFIESFTSPAVQFSNDPATGRQSTLSGAPIHGFEAFAGSGIQTRVLVTVGVLRRF